MSLFPGPIPKALSISLLTYSLLYTLENNSELISRPHAKSSFTLPYLPNSETSKANFSRRPPIRKSLIIKSPHHRFFSSPNQLFTEPYFGDLFTSVKSPLGDISTLVQPSSSTTPQPWRHPQWTPRNVARDPRASATSATESSLISHSWTSVAAPQISISTSPLVPSSTSTLPLVPSSTSTSPLSLGPRPRLGS